MKKIVNILLIFLVILSCKNNTVDRPKKPKNLIKKEVMASIIYDMSIFTAAKGVNKKLIEANGILPEEYVYKKYNIDSTQFALSNEYYAYNIEDYEDIYSKVQTKLKNEKRVLDSLVGKENEARKLESQRLRNRRDSIKRAGGLKKEEKELLKQKGVTPNPSKIIDTLKRVNRQ